MTKKIFTYSLAVAAMLASCNDDFQTYEAGNATGTKGKLVEAGLIGAGVESESETRAFSPNGGFVWMPEALNPSNGELTAERLNQKIGLCWTGVNKENAEYGAAASAGVNVFTNYEYEHIGWLETNQTEVLLDECTGEIKNGAYIQGEGLTLSSLLAEFNGDWSAKAGSNAYKGRYNKYYYGETSGKSVAGKDLSLGAGIFKTNNATVFEGQYVVYFPYTEKFTRGPIIANSPSYFENVQTGTNLPIAEADQLATASKYAFQMGYITHYEGGNRSSRFLTKNYSSFVRLYLYDGDAAHSDVMKADIKTVILYSPSQGVIYETGVSAASVINNQGDMTKVEKVGAPVTTNALYAHLTDEDATNEGAYVEWNTTSKTHLVTLPVLPQNVEDLKVILINADDKSMEFSLSDADKNWIAGQPVKINLNMDRKAFTNTYYAVDEPTFASALNKINQSGDNSGTIKILRNIDMVPDNNDKYETNVPGTVASKVIGIYKNISIVADDSNKDACITIKGDKTAQTQRIIEQYVAYDNTKKAQLTVNVPVIVEGYGCCDNYSAMLNIGGVHATYEDVITFNKPVTNYGITKIGGDKGKTNIVFNDVVNNIWDTEYVTNTISKYTNKAYTQATKERAVNNSAFLKNAAKMTIATSEAENEEVKFNSLLKNEGTINVSSQNPLTTKDAEGTRSLKVYIKKIENTGVLAVNKTKATTATDIIGGDINISANSLVVTEEGIKNQNIYAYINVAGEGNSDTNDGRLDVKQADISVNKGTIENNGVINLLGGSLDNSEGLFVDNLTGQVGGIAVDNGDEPAAYITRYYKGIEGANDYLTDLKTGIFVAKTATNDRMAFIINDDVESKSAVVIEVVGVDGTYYDFSKPQFKGNDLEGYDVRINSTTPISFVAKQKDTEGNLIEEKTIGHCMDVYSDMKVGSSNILNVENNVFVRKNVNVEVTKYIAEFKIGNNLTVEQTATVNTVAKDAQTKSEKSELFVKNDIFNYGTIISNRTFFVDRDFRIYATGELDSYGTPNTVTRNFILAGKASFDRYTTTTIKGEFESGKASQFVRKGLGSSDVYRATVNVGKLGKTEGAATGGWPTQM